MPYNKKSPLTIPLILAGLVLLVTMIILDDAPQKTINPKSVSEIFATARTKVVMFSTSWCPFCASARKYLQAHSIPYAEYDIERSAAAREAHSKSGGGGVPLFLVGTQRIHGFDPQALSAAAAQLPLDSGATPNGQIDPY